MIILSVRQVDRNSSIITNSPDNLQTQANKGMQGVEDEWGGHVLNLVRGDKLSSLCCGVTRLYKQAATKPHEAGERRYDRASNENSFTHCKIPIEK